MAKMCEVLGVSRSGYYAWAKRPERQQKKRQEALKKQIKKIHTESRETYGSPKILQEQGMEVSQKKKKKTVAIKWHPCQGHYKKRD
ncbi:hypothetical protein NOW01_05830 [Anoxybacillus salavatliensis]|nr:IS3 family transposase [Anoxybacillus gonensis]MCQ5364523.1 hypothetical protein [Anoxybacillus gonensis]